MIRMHWGQIFINWNEFMQTRRKEEVSVERLGIIKGWIIVEFLSRERN